MHSRSKGRDVILSEPLNQEYFVQIKSSPPVIQDMEETTRHERKRVRALT